MFESLLCGLDKIDKMTSMCYFTAARERECIAPLPTLFELGANGLFRSFATPHHFFLRVTYMVVLVSYPQNFPSANVGKKHGQ